MTTFLAQMTTASLTAIMTVFLVRSLGAREYGVFALAIGMSAIAIALADLGISDSTARFVAEHRESHDSALSALVSDALKLKLVATGTFCALFAAAAPLIADAYGNQSLVWPIRGIALATFGQSTYSMLIGVSTALGRSAVNVRLVAFESVIEVAASVGLVLAGAGAAGAAFGRAAGFCLGALLASVVVLRLSGHSTTRFWRRPQRETMRLVGGYAGPVFAIDASYTLSSTLCVLLLGAIAGSAASGVFTAPFKLITLIQYVGLATSYGVAPRLSRGAGQQPNTLALNRALRGLIGFQCLALAPAVVWARPITHLLLGRGYAGSATVLAALAPYIFFSGLAPLVTSGVSYVGEAKKRVPIALATVLLVAVCGLVLIPSHGVVGAAIATDIAFGFYTLAHIWLCRGLLELRIVMLLWSLVCGLTAAAAMGIVLATVGTRDLTVGDWLLGSTGGLAAYVAMLVFTREIRGEDIGRARAAIGRRFGRGAEPGSTHNRAAEIVVAAELAAPTDVAAMANSVMTAEIAAVANTEPGDAGPGADAVEPAASTRAGRRGPGQRGRGRRRLLAPAKPRQSRRRAGNKSRSPAAEPPSWLTEATTTRKEPARSDRPIIPGTSETPDRGKATPPSLSPPVGAAIIYEIGWRLLTDREGVFELQPLDPLSEHPPPAARPKSPRVQWRWRLAPAPTLDARRAHAALVDRLVAASWRPAGSGDAWFQGHFEAPAMTLDATPAASGRSSRRPGRGRKR